MTKFDPPFSSRKTVDLVLIVNASEDEWQIDAINSAKVELRKRGVNNHEQTIIYNNYVKKRKEEQEIKLESRAAEDYSLDEKVFIVLRWPIYIFRDWGLKNEGYLLKAKNRVRLKILIFPNGKKIE